MDGWSWYCETRGGLRLMALFSKKVDYRDDNGPQQCNATKYTANNCTYGC